MLKQPIYPDDPRYLAELSNWYMNEDICSHDFLYKNHSLLFWWGIYPVLITDKEPDESHATGSTIVVTLRNDLNPKEPPRITKLVAYSPNNLHASERVDLEMYRQMANMVTLLVGADTTRQYRGRTIPRGQRRGEIVQLDIYPSTILSTPEFQSDLTPTMTWTPEIPYHFPVRFGFRDMTSESQIQRQLEQDSPQVAVVVDLLGDICNTSTGPQNGRVEWYRDLGF